MCLEIMVLSLNDQRFGLMLAPESKSQNAVLLHNDWPLGWDYVMTALAPVLAGRLGAELSEQRVQVRM